MWHFRLTIGRKLYAIIALCLVGFVGVSALGIRELQLGLQDQKQIELRHLGDIALGIAKEEYASIQQGGISSEDAQRRAAARIGKLRYGTDGYFSISDLHPLMVMHPIKPELNGNDLTDYKDANGKHLFVEFADAVKRDGTAFIGYLWPKPGADKAQPKLSYVVGFAPWQWVIATGVYIDDLEQQVWNAARQVIMIVTVLALIVSAASVAVARNVAGPIRRIAELLLDLANGNKTAEIPYVTRRDEIGEVAQAATKFRENLLHLEKLEAEKAASEIESRKVSADNMRIRVALDNCTTNVMVADTDGQILYLNKSVMETMRAAEPELRKELKGFDAGRLVGANIDAFHKNPAHQRAMLERLSAPHRTSISVAGRSFDLIANPVLDSSGTRLGSVVEWHDVTQERKVEDEIDQVVSAAVGGNFRETIRLEGKQGFMLKLAEGMNRLCKTMADVMDDVNAGLGALSRGDLTRRITQSYGGQFDDLKTSINETSDRLAEIVGQVFEAANEVTSAAAEITTGTNDLSQRTEQQASNLEETAASMEQMASTVKQNADNAAQANQLAISARAVATGGGGIVSKAVEAMSGIEGSSQKISDIIGVIDEIAFQTNLLALNAAVEAARAGDAGKGFAVVASEVRSLAQRSSEAAKDIKGLIVESGRQVKDGVKLVNDAGTSLTEIVDSIKRVADIVSEIAAASKEQSTGVEEINNAVSQMDEMTQQNSALVEQSAAASRTLQEQAHGLHERMSFFKTDAADTAERQPAREERRPAAAAPRPAAKPMARPARAPVRKVAAAGGAAQLQSDLHAAITNDTDWKEF